MKLNPVRERMIDYLMDLNKKIDKCFMDDNITEADRLSMEADDLRKKLDKMQVYI